jgi:hypothetical protein
MKKRVQKYTAEIQAARRLWGNISKPAVRMLLELIKRLDISVSMGDIQLLNGHWYITHSGLINLAHRRRCCSVVSAIDRKFSDAAAGRWVFKATVYPSNKSRGFVGYGDADPSNVSSMVQGAELRIAETRAVNRALRKAYGIGICSVEELGFSSPAKSNGQKAPVYTLQNGNGARNDQSRLRDRLCLLIREHRLNAGLVKSYAADFCGTDTVSAASRDSIESFICHLSSAAKENRDALICKLNSYAQPVQANS